MWYVERNCGKTRKWERGCSVMLGVVVACCAGGGFSAVTCCAKWRLTAQVEWVCTLVLVIVTRGPPSAPWGPCSFSLAPQRKPCRRGASHPRTLNVPHSHCRYPGGGQSGREGFGCENQGPGEKHKQKKLNIDEAEGKKTKKQFPFHFLE